LYGLSEIEHAVIRYLLALTPAQLGFVEWLHKVR
jgi:hypothetical protein